MSRGPLILMPLRRRYPVLNEPETNAALRTFQLGGNRPSPSNSSATAPGSRHRVLASLGPLPLARCHNHQSRERDRYNAWNRIMNTYTIRSGDTLSAIARRFGLPLHLLIEVNNIADPNKVKVGRILTLPPMTTDSTDHIETPVSAALSPTPIAITRVATALHHLRLHRRKHPKDLIVLHFTAGPSARSAFNTWIAAAPALPPPTSSTSTAPSMRPSTPATGPTISASRVHPRPTTATINEASASNRQRRPAQAHLW